MILLTIKKSNHENIERVIGKAKKAVQKLFPNFLTKHEIEKDNEALTVNKKIILFSLQECINLYLNTKNKIEKMEKNIPF